MIVIETKKFKEAQQQVQQVPQQQQNVRQDPMFQKLQALKQRLGIDNRLMTMLSNPQYGPCRKIGCTTTSDAATSNVAPAAGSTATAACSVTIA